MINLRTKKINKNNHAAELLADADVLKESPEETVSRLSLMGGYLSHVFMANCPKLHRAAEVKVAKLNKIFNVLEKKHKPKKSIHIFNSVFKGDLQRHSLAL